jgi:hypothetical protein
MTTKWALLETIQREPDNQVACYTMADLLEEEGWPQRALRYRWMGWYGRRPGTREGKGLRKRFVWYKDGACLECIGEAEHYDRLPAARLNAIGFLSLEPVNPQYHLSSAWEEAVNDLAKGLPRMGRCSHRLPNAGTGGRTTPRKARRGAERIRPWPSPNHVFTIPKTTSRGTTTAMSASPAINPEASGV